MIVTFSRSLNLTFPFLCAAAVFVVCTKHYIKEMWGELLISKCLEAERSISDDFIHVYSFAISLHEVILDCYWAHTPKGFFVDVIVKGPWWLWPTKEDQGSWQGSSPASQDEPTWGPGLDTKPTLYYAHSGMECMVIEHMSEVKYLLQYIHVIT